MVHMTICPVCGGKLNRVKKNWKGEHKGQKYIVPELVYYACTQCHEKILPREAMRRIEEYSPAFQVKIVKTKEAA